MDLTTPKTSQRPQSQPDLSADYCSNRVLALELDGEKLQHPEDLIFLISRRLSLPDISTLDQDVVANAIGRRLTLMANANRFVDVAVINENKTPKPVLAYLKTLAEDTPLRLTLQDDQKVVAPAPPILSPAERSTISADRSPKGNKRLVIAAGIAATICVMALVIGLRQKPEPSRASEVVRVIKPALPEPTEVEPVEVEPVERVVVPTAENEAAQEDATPKLGVAQESEVPEPAEVAQNFRYTIQIASYLSIVTRDRFLERYPELKDNLRSETSLNTGEIRYLAVYGKYVGYIEAYAALESLPDELNNAQPFVIGLSQISDDMH